MGNEQEIEDTQAQDSQPRQPVAGPPPAVALGEPLPRYQRILLGILAAGVTIAALALVISMLEELRLTVAQ